MCVCVCVCLRGETGRERGKRGVAILCVCLGVRVRACVDAGGVGGYRVRFIMHY